MLKLPLAKAAVAFDESKHPRAQDGRFSSSGTYSGPAHAYRMAEHDYRRRQKLRSLDSEADRLLGANPETPGDAPSPIRHGEGRPLFSEKRSNIRNTWTTGTKIAELPVAYTGSKERELPVGSFTHHAVNEQIPDALAVGEHKAILRSLVRTAHAERQGTIERGTERGHIPEGTERRTVNRAFNHATMHALHKFGIVDYDFKMDDALKAEMKPLVPFMRYAERRVRDKMLANHKGAWRPYRREFGMPFADNRKDKVTGEVRLRVRPNQEFVKAAPVGTLLKAA